MLWASNAIASFKQETPESPSLIHNGSCFLGTPSYRVRLSQEVSLEMYVGGGSVRLRCKVMLELLPTPASPTYFRSKPPALLAWTTGICLRTSAYSQENTQDSQPARDIELSFGFLGWKVHCRSSSRHLLRGLQYTYTANKQRCPKTSSLCLVFGGGME